MKKLSIFCLMLGFGLLVSVLTGVHSSSALTRAVGSCPKALILDTFSDNAAPTLAYVNKHEMKLYVGESYGGKDDGNSPEIISQVDAAQKANIVALDTLPAGLTIKQQDVTYAAKQSIGAGPWSRTYISGTPAQVGTTKVRLQATYTYQGLGCTDSGYINFVVAQKPASRAPETTSFSPVNSAGGKIQFLKKALYNKQADPNGEAMLHNIIAIKDKFVVDADCGQDPNLWVLKEDGSQVLSSRHSCKDATGGVWGDVYNGHGRISSALKLDWGNQAGAFVHEIQGGGQGGNLCLMRGPSGEPGDCAEWTEIGVFSNAVYYEMATNGSLTPVAVSPKQEGTNYYNRDLAILNSKAISAAGRIMTLPGWNKGNSVGAIGTAVGYGNYLIQREGSNDTNGDWVAYTIAADGAKTRVKNLGIKHSASYTYDNSVWPPKLAFVEYANASSPAAIKVLNMSDLSLAKTLSLPAGALSVGAIRVGGKTGELAPLLAVWGDNVIFIGQKSTGQVYRTAGGADIYLQSFALQIWKNGQLQDSVDLFGSQFDNGITRLEITQNGYLALINSWKDNSVYIYKLNMSGAPAAQLNNFVPTLTACAQGHTYNYITGALCAGANALYSIFNNVPASSAPKIGEVNGPTSLSINQKGTWTLTATDPENDDLVWSVDWGGGKSGTSCPTILTTGTGQGTSYTASHSWVTSGSHTVKFYANDCKGGISEKSFTVRVGGGGSGKNQDYLDAN